MSEDRVQKRKVMKSVLKYWPLISTGANSVDTKSKKEVAVVQEVLSATGHYTGNVDGKYNPETDGARWRFVKDIMSNSEFSFDLIKQNAKDIGDMMNELGMEEERYG
tara:strand:- start:1186 stop:1506 length:321 start_codon:yes stop_codon:yes gene_type:complete